MASLPRDDSIVPCPGKQCSIQIYKQRHQRTSSDLLGGSSSGFFGASQMAKYGSSAKMPVAKEAVMKGHAGICTAS